MKQEIDAKYIHIAEISENIANLNEMIDLHQKTTQNQSMIKQYQFKRAEFVEELQQLLKPLNLKVSLNAI